MTERGGIARSSWRSGGGWSRTTRSGRGDRPLRGRDHRGREPGRLAPWRRRRGARAPGLPAPARLRGPAGQRRLRRGRGLRARPPGRSSPGPCSRPGPPRICRPSSPPPRPLRGGPARARRGDRRGPLRRGGARRAPRGAVHKPGQEGRARRGPRRAARTRACSRASSTSVPCGWSPSRPSWTGRRAHGRSPRAAGRSSAPATRTRRSRSPTRRSTRRWPASRTSSTP